MGSIYLKNIKVRIEYFLIKERKETIKWDRCREQSGANGRVV